MPAHAQFFGASRVRRAALAGALLCGVFLGVRLSSADVVVLNNDGRVSGTLVNPNESPRKNYIVRTEIGEITIDKSQVKEVIRQSPEELEYERIRFTFPDTAEEQWKLAEWCRDKGLSQQRTFHMERVIQLDPDHKQARAGLGYGQADGRWVRREDVMKERGYVRYKGRWMLPQDVEIQERKRQVEMAQKEWYNKLRRLRGQLDDRGPRAALALAELKNLSDPEAVPAIAELLKSERVAAVKRLLINALGRTKSPDAVRVLADVALEASDEDMRFEAISYLKEMQSPAAVSYLVDALKSRDNVRINRAGDALGELGDKSAIGPLIAVLVTVHKEKVQQGGAGSLSPSFDSNGGIGFGVGGKSVILRHNVQNRGVHAGLVKLAGGPDFGFDGQAWGNWHASQRKAEIVPGRRD
jgi:hypothetical protein